MSIRLGWCLTGHHSKCPGEKKLSDGKTHVCNCPHHEKLKKELEDLL